MMKNNCCFNPKNHPFYSFDDEMKARFGGKVYRLALSASQSCPNRDGICGTGGCIFCSAGGSGDFAESAALEIEEQIERAKARVSRKLSRNFAGYMAYFQSYTGTYGDQIRLATAFRKAAAHPDIMALSVATRPDCIEPDMLAVLADIHREKPVYVELGLQTIHEDTARYINRGYQLNVFEECFHRLKAAGFAVVVHVIIGLPGEDAGRTGETVLYLANLTHEGQHIDGIKLQLLHVLRDTRLAVLMPRCPDVLAQEDDVNKDACIDKIILNDGGWLPCYNIQTYAGLVTELVAMLPPDIAVHRVTGDAPKRLLLYPAWSADKKRVLNTVRRAFAETGRTQDYSHSPDRRRAIDRRDRCLSTALEA